MMIFKIAVLLLASPLLVAGESCLGDTNFSLNTDGCTYDDLKDAINEELNGTNCNHGAATELELLLDANGEAEAREAVAGVCAEGYLVYQEITAKNKIFDKEYFDGGTYWNEERESETKDSIVNNRLAVDPGERIDQIHEDIAQSRGITMPNDVDNFDDCELRAAMCCFVQDRQANDNNGNCATPYDENCVDANPADNTDVCYADFSRAPTSSRTTEGYAIFPDGDEDDSHCHGFAWAKDPTDPSASYKGNNLFYVSMYDHFYQRGYVRNVPGAPMCGCIEKMPVVTRSDCTQIDVNAEATEWTHSANEGLSAEITDLDIEFNSCQGANNNNNDLEAYYEQLVNDGKADAEELEDIREFLVGEDKCPQAINEFLEVQGLELINQDNTPSPTDSPTISPQPTPGDLDAGSVNLALTGTATQSSTCHGGNAARAKDGNSNGQWGSQTITHTCRQKNPWWKLELQDDHSLIEKIVVFNRQDCCSYRLNDADVRVLDPEGEVIADEFIGLARDGESFTFEFKDRVFGAAIEVQLNQEEPEYLSLAEVQVFGKDGARRLTESASQSKSIAQASLLRGQTFGN